MLLVAHYKVPMTLKEFKEVNYGRYELSNEIMLMRQIRLWEKKNYSAGELNNLMSTVKSHSIPAAKIRDIAVKYTRFSEGTWKKLQPHISQKTKN